ncbi:hypothetical protein I7I48_02616 [Histoplasma ohiense]|nr:hypothetical protein I7I48_02616 [Histoplasma ohiense (nom. inval.)]
MGYRKTVGKTRVLLGESGSGDRCITASSSSGGWPEFRTLISRARSAELRSSFSLRARSSSARRLAAISSRADLRADILADMVCNGLLGGSKASPLAHVSSAWRILSSAKRAQVDR